MDMPAPCWTRLKAVAIDPTLLFMDLQMCISLACFFVLCPFQAAWRRDLLARTMLTPQQLLAISFIQQDQSSRFMLANRHSTYSDRG